MPPEDLPAPLRWAAACSYLPATPEALARQRALLESAAAPPEALWQALRRHRIVSLAEAVLRRHRLLAQLGPYAADLGAATRQLRFAALRQTAAAAGVSALLDARSIAHSWLKGPTLSQQLYGDPGLRHSKDLDLLVDPDTVAPTLDALEGAGWVPLRHRGLWGRHRLYRWLAERRLRHLTLRHAGAQVYLELHWRREAIHSPSLEGRWRAAWPPGSPPLSPGGILYLCLHGAQHAWIRLKWLGDLQAIAEQRPGLWEELAPLAGRLRLGEVVTQTRTLLTALYHPSTPAPPPAPLAAFALANLQWSSAEVTDSPEHSLAYRRYLWRLNRRIPAADRALELCGFCLSGAADLEGWNLPAAALPTAPFRQVARLARRYGLPLTRH